MTLEADIGILNLIQLNLRCEFLDVAMPLITKLGDGGALWILCSFLLFLFPQTRRSGAAIAVGILLELLCCNALLKPFVGRPRPCDVNSAVQLLISKPTDFSFPSGHTGAAFATVSALYFSKNRFWIPTLVISLWISFSRLYLYVHYPSDVLAGALLGIMLGWIGTLFIRTAEKMIRKRQNRT